jgi:two-component system sensor histidine kinase/response regulator
MMHGRIWVESQPGVGSTFHFLASFEPAPLAAAAAEQRDPALLREKHALIVDDNATNRLILEKTLARWGMHTQSVESGAEGLAQLAAANQNGEPFSILIVDGQMPEMDGFTMVRKLRECPDFNPLTIVMLTSAGAVGDAERCRELGIRGFLAKPVDGETLHSAILRALGQTTDQPIRVSPDAESSAPPGIAYKILLAEDNPVNQIVATRHLEKLGHALKIAANGRRAVEMWEQDQFDLILMDVQMPEMSGYEATAEIRRREKQTRRHVPIIAMTAHAMVGDREKCLSAGMDGYVSKPIQIDTLAAEISNVLKGFLAAPPSPVPPPIVSTLNRGLLVTLMDGDLELLTTSVEICQGEFPRLLGELHAAADADDARQLERAGHALKGMLRGLAGEAAAALAQKLEDMGRGSELSGSRAVLAELETEMHRFDRELLQLLEDAKGANSLASIS